MTAIPTIVKIIGFGDSLDIFLRNTGTSLLPEGNIFVMQTNNDGTIQRRRIGNLTPLNPGETTKIIDHAIDAKTIQIHEYRSITVKNEQSFPMQGQIQRKLLGWKYSA